MGVKARHGERPQASSVSRAAPRETSLSASSRGRNTCSARSAESVPERIKALGKAWRAASVSPSGGDPGTARDATGTLAQRIFRPPPCPHGPPRPRCRRPQRNRGRGSLSPSWSSPRRVSSAVSGDAGAVTTTAFSGPSSTPWRPPPSGRIQQHRYPQPQTILSAESTKALRPHEPIDQRRQGPRIRPDGSARSRETWSAVAAQKASGGPREGPGWWPGPRRGPRLLQRPGKRPRARSTSSFPARAKLSSSSR